MKCLVHFNVILFNYSNNENIEFRNQCRIQFPNLSWMVRRNKYKLILLLLNDNFEQLISTYTNYISNIVDILKNNLSASL